MPWHKNRKWIIRDASSAEELAKDLTQYSWTLCSGFRLDGFLFLNDATSEDGAQEYLVVREADMAEVESITMSWCDEAKALGYIRATINDPTPHVYGHTDRRQVQTKEEHGTCWACA